MKCHACNGKKYTGSKKKRVTCAACAGTGDATPTPLPPVRTDDPAVFDATPATCVDETKALVAEFQRQHPGKKIDIRDGELVLVPDRPEKIVIDIDVIARAFAGRVRATKE